MLLLQVRNPRDSSVSYASAAFVMNWSKRSQPSPLSLSCKIFSSFSWMIPSESSNLDRLWFYVHKNKVHTLLNEISGKIRPIKAYGKSYQFGKTSLECKWSCLHEVISWSVTNCKFSFTPALEVLFSNFEGCNFFICQIIGHILPNSDVQSLI